MQLVEKRIQKEKAKTISKAIEPRKCPRLKEVDDKNITDKAKERSRVKDLKWDRGMNMEIPSVVNSSNISLGQISSVLGVNLGCSLETIDQNIELIKNLEQARINLFIEEQKRQNQVTKNKGVDQSNPVPQIPIELL